MRLPEQRFRGVLSPYDRASEVLFGVIMALTLTGALSVTGATEQETRALFLSTLGCNVAWGLVDAVMYVLNGVLGRSRRFLLARALREGSDIPAVLSEVLPAPLVEGLSATEVERIRRKVASADLDLRQPSRIRGEDLLGAVGVFLLVVASTFPVALPYLLTRDLALAKMVSRGLALGLLFVSGYAVGRYSGLRPGRVGLAMLATGAVLVAAVTGLGG
ncbi:MAG TPA: hypothetical protein VFD38_05945 [Myxococcaceae bacterium]|nr:hypothetical protein [Myxococcaceae bacterium]